VRSTRWFTLLVGVLATTFAVAATPAGAAESAVVATVEVQGTLLVAQSDLPGSLPTYAVALADGDLVPVRGPLADARPFSHFTGRLALPDSVVSAMAAGGSELRQGASLEATSDAGQDALRLVDHRSLTLLVSGTPSLTGSAPAVTATAHRQFVSAIDNKGSLGESDRTLLGHVRTVASYWKAEANGAISSIVVPAKVTRYKTGLTTKDCGLGADFFDVVQEAAAKFPGIDLSGSDQLVVFVPHSCPSGMAGEGTIGSSFASGGAVIVKTGKAITGTYGHETGHNYGFDHANARRSGTSMEYYGAYDVMGFELSGYNQLTALSTPYRVFQGITDAGEIVDVPLGLGTKQVQRSATIRPRSRATGLRSIRVVDPDTGEALYLDYRSGTGEDARAYYTAHGTYLTTGRGPLRYARGVTINAARDDSGVDTLVVDGRGDTSLGAGSTWTNASGDLTVHVGSLEEGGVHVTVRFTPSGRS
jgi:hypothetical protein